MNHLVLFAALLVASSIANAATLDVDRMADAIYRAEGGAKTRHPYGVLSVKVNGEAEARRVCCNTIRNNWARWQASGQTGTFVEFLAGRYCPKSADPVGNARWIKNMNEIYGKI